MIRGFEQKYQYGTIAGTLAGNIADLLKYIDMSEVDVCQCDVGSLRKISKKQINEEHAATADLTQPIIISILSSEKELIIDGNHRIYRAQNDGKNTLNAIFLAEEEHKKFIENFESELYKRVVLQSPKHKVRRLGQRHQ